MKQKKAYAVITPAPERGWCLPAFGTRKPDRFRYQAYAHFEKDTTWGKKAWTLIVEFSKEPEPFSNSFEALVYFMAPDAPVHLFENGAQFQLLHGNNTYGTGTITNVFDSET